MSAKSEKYISLLETAKTLFFRHGIRRVTIEEICAQSKVSKVTFYKYFKDKDDLIRVIREELTLIGFARLDEINALPLSYPEKVERMTAWRMQFFASMKSDFIKEIIDIKSVSEEIKQRLSRKHPEGTGGRRDRPYPIAGIDLACHREIQRDC